MLGFAVALTGKQMVDFGETSEGLTLKIRPTKWAFSLDRS
jgi:hypothetical protein